MIDFEQSISLDLVGVPGPQAQRVRLFRLVLALSSELRYRLDRALQSDGLTTQQAMLLHHIEVSAAPPRMTELARAMGVSHQNIKQLALALERKGFLAIQPDPSDGRAKCLVLCPQHRATWTRRNAGDFDLVCQWTSALGDDDINAMVSSITTLLADLDARQRPADDGITEAGS